MGSAANTLTVGSAAGDIGRLTRPQSQWAIVWRQLRLNRAAMIGTALVLFEIVLALTAPWITPYDPFDQDPLAALQAPSREHVFGTDDTGRDLFSRVIDGTHFALRVGLISVGISSIPYYTRVARGSSLALRDREFVLGARAIGCGDAHITRRYILPNVLPPLIVLATLGIASAILTAAGLSFIGLGAVPPAPEWGAILTLGRKYINQAWWYTTFPGLAIIVTVLGINMLGDALRDAFARRDNGGDPRNGRRWRRQGP